MRAILTRENFVNNSITYNIICITEGYQLKTIKPFPTLTLFKKGGNGSIPYIGPKTVVDLEDFVNDGFSTDYNRVPPPPKVREEMTQNPRSLSLLYYSKQLIS